MDIHRCRFVPYKPQSINTLAFSHTSNPQQHTPSDLRLALGRENGDVEIWNPVGGNWFQEKVLRGSQGRTIEQLVWTQDLLPIEEPNNTYEVGNLRLFSSGGSSSITEWDLVKGQPKRHAEGNSADIWCFAVQPQWKQTDKKLKIKDVAAAPSQLLAAGCSDGSVVLFTTADDTLEYLRVLATSPTRKAKVISIAWRDRNTVLAGYEDSMIRVIDVPSRKVLRTMTLGKSTNDVRSVVWTLKCLPNGTILSGDSSGELKIWDAKTLALNQRIKTHDADILDIAVTTNGDAIFTTGVDRRVVCYKQVAIQTGKQHKRWQKTMSRRYHQHDVKALASFESNDLSIMVSGGTDTVPIVLPLRRWESEYHRSLSHLPQTPQVSCSAKAHLMLTWWERHISLWQVPNRPRNHPTDLAVTPGSNHQLLAQLYLNSEENITSAQISGDGSLIVVATATEVKLFQVRRRIQGGEIEIRTRPIDLPISMRSFGALLTGFSPDSKWMFAVRPSNLIVLVNVLPGPSNKEKPNVHPQVVKLARKQKTSARLSKSKLGSYLESISCVTFSTDSRILAAGDLSGAVDIWLLEGHEDTQQQLSTDSSEESENSDSDSDSEDESDSPVIHGQKWIRSPSGLRLPHFDSSILALSFKPQYGHSTDGIDTALGLHATRHNPHPVAHELPSAGAKLIVVTALHQIIELDMFSGRLSDWSRQNPSSCLPQSFAQIKDRAMGIFWDVQPSQKRERLWLYGPTWLFMLDMTRNLSLVDAQNKVGQIGRYDVRERLTDHSRKQVRQDDILVHMKKKRKRNTGAGDEMKPEEDALVPAKNLDLARSRGDTGLPSPVSDQDNDDDRMEIDDDNMLTYFRRGSEQPDTGPDSIKEEEEEQSDRDDTERTDEDTNLFTSTSPAYHTIFRYRSIFGIIAIPPGSDSPAPSSLPKDEDEETDEIKTSSSLLKNDTDPPKNSDIDIDIDIDVDTDQPAPPSLEIILIERPMYDVELPPRFDGGQDWST